MSPRSLCVHKVHVACYPRDGNSAILPVRYGTVSTFVDFAQVKEQHPIDKVAELLGLKLKKNGAQYRGPSWTGEGDERAVVITPSKGVFFNFAIQEGGDCIKLVSLVKGIPAKDAAAWILGNISNDDRPEKSKKTEQTEGFKPLEYLSFDHDAVIALGFDASDAEKIGIGYASRGIFRGRVVVPVRLSDGKLIGYIAIQDCELPSSWRW